MTPEQLVHTLRARGVNLKAEGERLRVRPASAVLPEEIEALRRHKAEVLDLLTSPTPSRGAYSYPWPDELPGLGRRTVGPFDTCEECPAGTWVRYGSTVLCLEHALRRLRDPRH